MKLAAVQLRPDGNREGTIKRAGELIDDASNKGADIILLPEFFAIPFVQPEPDPEYFAWGEPLNGPSNAMAAERSRKYENTIVSSIFENSDVPGVYYNTACTFVRGELKSIYRKSHLPYSNGFPEKFYFRPGGTAPTTVDTGDVRLGTIICYERHFPELSRLVALQGASVMCVPVASSSIPMLDVFQLELRAHAAFNHLYVICSNRVGLEGEKDYFGLSAIYDPNGRAVAEASRSDEGVIVADMDPTVVQRARQSRPFFRDRRPELYPSLSEMVVQNDQLPAWFDRLSNSNPT